MDEPTVPQQIAQLYLQISFYVMGISAERGYSSPESCISYYNSSVPQWASEANTFLLWRDSAYQIINPIMNAIPPEGPVPALDDIVSQIPVIVWP